MEKKTITIIIVAVVAIAIIAGIVIAVSAGSNNDDSGKYVTYEGNGGITSPDGSTSYKWNSETVDDIRFFKDNYQLTSFNDKKDGTGKEYHTGDHVDYGTTLYAQWTKITNTNVKIITNDNTLPYITIKNNSVTLSVGDNVLTNDDCKFTIDFESLDGYTLTEGTTSFYQFFIKDATDNTVCTVQLVSTFYSEAGHHDLRDFYGADKISFTSEYAKEVSVTLTYAN